MRSIICTLIVCLAVTLPVSAVVTSHWSQTTEADFKTGTFHNVVATNFGDLKLSRAVKTILGQDSHVSAVHVMVEAPDADEADAVCARLVAVVERTASPA